MKENQLINQSILKEKYEKTFTNQTEAWQKADIINNALSDYPDLKGQRLKTIEENGKFKNILWPRTINGR